MAMRQIVLAKIISMDKARINLLRHMYLDDVSTVYIDCPRWRVGEP